MVSKREKLRSSLSRVRKDLFFQQVATLRTLKLGSKEYEAVAVAHRQDLSIYDKPQAVLDAAAALCDVDVQGLSEDEDSNVTASLQCAADVSIASRSRKIVKKKKDGKGQGQKSSHAAVRDCNS